MKTHTPPQRPAISLTGISLLIAILTAGGVSNAQQPPAATPAPVTPPKAQPVADEPAPALRSTERNSVPAKESSATAESVAPADPKARVLELTDPRTKSAIRLEKDASGGARTIVRTILNEEVSSNPQEAARNYEAVIAAFDSQRENAAQAIFRLGESYRKLGRLEEARIQYARILREFVDFPDLARLSQKQLAQNPPNVSSSGTRTTGEESTAGSTARATAASAEDRKLLLEEIALLDRQLEETYALVKSGVAPASSVFPIQREILQLKRQLLRLGSPNSSGSGSSSSGTRSSSSAAPR